MNEEKHGEKVKEMRDSVISQAISYQSRVRPHFKIMWDLWCEQSGTKGRFPPSSLVSPANSHSPKCSHNPGLVKIGQLVADVPSGLSLTPTPSPTNGNKKGTNKKMKETKK
jgi:hypothetical protein